MDYNKEEEMTFRNDLFRRLDNQDKMLEKIDTKQAVANGRTSKLEMWQKLVVVGSIVVYTITITIGGVFARLYVQDVARTIAQESVKSTLESQKSDIAKEVVSQLEKQYNLKIND